MHAVRGFWVAPVLLAVGVGLAFAACRDPVDDDSIYGNGRIEGDEVRVAAEIPGRIEKLTVQEGDRVQADELVAELSTDETRARLEEAGAAVQAAEAAVAAAEARVETLEHHEATARTDHERLQALYRAGAISGRELDRAENALAEAAGERAVAEKQLRQARAQRDAAAAAEAAVRTRLADARVIAPLDGVVLLRLAEPGEVVQAGQPLVILVDPGDLFLDVYIEERQIGKVRVGNPARVTVDAFPQRTFDGVVSEVAQRAEFTPRDVHMPDERATQVFAVKIRLRNDDGFLKPGMPADAEILWRMTPDSDSGGAARPELEGQR